MLDDTAYNYTIRKILIKTGLPGDLHEVVIGCKGRISDIAQHYGINERTAKHHKRILSGIKITLAESLNMEPYNVAEELFEAQDEESYTEPVKKPLKTILQADSGIPDDDEIRKALELLSRTGKSIIMEDLEKPVIDVAQVRRKAHIKSFKVGIVSDTHLCSHHQQLTHLTDFYRRCKDEGCEHVLHGGDLVAGNNVYKGQMFDLFLHGADAQKNYCVRNYPAVQGIKTHVIMGNHDESFIRSAGVDIVPAICDQRDDMVFAGHYAGYVTINGIRFKLQHGIGGATYAVSYKIQKYLEQIASENKPHILILGHYHDKSLFMGPYRNMYGIHPGCFEGQSLLGERMGKRPVVQGVILEVRYTDDDKINIVSITPEFMPYFVPIERDY